MNKYLFSIILILGINLLYGQEQVSDFYNEYAGNYSGKQFVFFQETEYLIEHGKKQTKVSKVLDGTIELIHSMDYRPVDELSVFFYDFNINNSGLVTRDSLLIEVYTSSIYITNFVTGELHRILDFYNEDVSFIGRKVVLNEDILIIEAKKDEERFYCSINLKNGVLKSTNRDFFEWKLSDTWLYKVDSTRKKLLAFDIINEEQTTIIDGGDTLKLYVDYLGKTRVKSKLNTLYEVKDGIVSKTSDCFYNTNGEISDFYFTDSLVFVAYYYSGELRLYGKYLYNCEQGFVEYLGSVPPNLYNVFRFYNSKELKDYVLFGVVGDFFGVGNFGILDIKNKSVTFLPIYTDALTYYKTLLIEDTYYILGFDDVELFGFVGSCHTIDLLSKEVTRIPFPHQDSISFLQIGEHRSDGKVSFFADQINSSNSNLYSYDHNSSQLEVLANLSKLINVGLRNKYDDIVVNDKFFYGHDNSISYTKGNQTTTLIDDLYKSSSFIQNEGYLYCLAQKEDTIFILKIDENSADITKEKLDNVIRFKNEGNTDNAILNFSYAYSEGNDGYWDVNTKSYYSVSIPNKYPRLAGISKNNIALRVTNDGGRHYLHNTLTKETTDLSTFLGFGYFRIYPNHRGGFLFFDNGSSIVQGRQVRVLDKDGISQYLDFSYSTAYYGDLDFKKSKQLDVVSLAGNDTTHFVMNDDEKTKLISIPNDRTLYYKPMKWIVNEDIVIASCLQDDLLHAYIISMDNQPVDVFPQGKSSLFRNVFVDGDNIVFSFRYGDEDIVELVVYSREQNTIQSTYTYDISKVKQADSFINLGEIGDGKYLYSYNNGQLGAEPYVLDIKTGNLEIISDMIEGQYGSEPKYFNILGDYVYYTALTEDESRQWFRVKLEDINLQSVVEKIELIDIFPNPSHDYISIDRELKAYKIYDMNGKMITMKAISDNREIDVSSLISGTYIIEAVGLDGDIYLAKFIKLSR